MIISNIGKWLVFAGVGIIVLGLIIIGLSKLGIPIGKLPGDIATQKENGGVYLPIASSIVISIILTIGINFFLWLFKK